MNSARIMDLEVVADDLFKIHPSQKRKLDEGREMT